MHISVALLKSQCCPKTLRRHVAGMTSVGTKAEVEPIDLLEFICLYTARLSGAGLVTEATLSCSVSTRLLNCQPFQWTSPAT